MKTWSFASALGMLVSALPATIAAQVTLSSSSVQEREAAPGETYTGTLTLTNTTGEPQEARVYQSDYEFHADGRTLYPEKGSTSRSNGRWLAVTPLRLVIPAGREATVSYRVTVPSAALRGTYWSLVLVETIPPGSLGSSRKPPAGARADVGIQSRLRYGVQIATHIRESGTRQVTFARPTVVRAPAGQMVLELDVLSTGDLACRPEVSVELYDGEGKLVRKLRQQRGLMYPGSSVRQRFELGPLRKGTYKALVLADTGDQEVFGAQYNLKF